jgi:hypothetical protein
LRKGRSAGETPWKRSNTFRRRCTPLWYITKHTHTWHECYVDVHNTIHKHAHTGGRPTNEKKALLVRNTKIFAMLIEDTDHNNDTRIASFGWAHAPVWSKSAAEWSLAHPYPHLHTHTHTHTHTAHKYTSILLVVLAQVELLLLLPPLRLPVGK